MLNLWQNIVFLVKGQVIYVGEISRMEAVLASLGHPRPLGTGYGNIVEFTLDIVGNDKIANHLVEEWEQKKSLINDLGNDSNKKMFYDAADLNAESTNETRVSEPSTYHHIKILSSRHLMYTIKAPHSLTFTLLRNIIAGLLYGYLFYNNQQEMDNEALLFDLTVQSFSTYTYNVQNLFFAIVIFLVLINSVAIPAMFISKGLYERERVSE